MGDGTGMSKKIDESEMKRFLMQSKAWSQVDLAKYLETRLCEASSGIQLKSLTVILALLNDRNTEIEDYFNENNSILKEIYENGSRSVKSEAKKVMRLCLDASDLSELLSSSQDRVQKGNPLQIQAQSIQSASSTSLLTQDASPTQQLFATQASSVAQQTSIFSDFESGSGVAETSEMFSGLELNPSSSQANPQQEPSKSAFDFMSEAQSHTGVVSASSDGFD